MCVAHDILRARDIAAGSSVAGLTHGGWFDLLFNSRVTIGRASA
ncbi:hypothetical protein STXM2123_1041 [Streptomyces sp. F-3]|nr:hypothetical protein STXM2123_1041 [Streptomyces sp. F-3]